MPAMLKHRLIFGPIMIGYLLGTLWLDQWLQDAGHARAGIAILALLILPGIVLAAYELAQLFRAKGVPIDGRVLAAAGVAGCVVVYFTTLATRFDWVQTVPPGIVVASLPVAALLLGVLSRCWRKNTADTMLTGATTLFACVYLGLMPGMLVSIRVEHSAWVLAALLLITKACDIGAYFTGRAIGRHKLIPWLSPGKTWEGLAGGVALASGVAVLALTPDAMAGLHWGFALVVGVVLALVGQAGDLLASMLKRDAAVKDSGSSIPGFGGVLDVFDSPLLAGPVAYWLLLAAG